MPDSKWYGYTRLSQEFTVDVRFLEYLSVRSTVGGADQEE